jgi:hypothetical protein
MLEKLTIYSKNGSPESRKNSPGALKKSGGDTVQIRKILDHSLKEKITRNILQINHFVKLLNSMRQMDLQLSNSEK